MSSYLHLARAAKQSANRQVETYEVNEVNEESSRVAGAGRGVRRNEVNEVTPTPMATGSERMELPTGCIGGIACKRLGPCDRHRAGRPCRIVDEEEETEGAAA